MSDRVLDDLSFFGPLTAKALGKIAGVKAADARTILNRAEDEGKAYRILGSPVAAPDIWFGSRDEYLFYVGILAMTVQRMNEAKS